MSLRSAVSQDSTINPTTYKTHHRSNNLWILSLFGTAVGAGILFLPINAGRAGFWPLMLMALITGPMIYYSHRGLSRLILSSTDEMGDITSTIFEHFNRNKACIAALIYFLAFYPVILIYGVGSTNTVSSFLEHQLHTNVPNRPLLSFIIISLYMLVLYCGEKVMLVVTEYLVYPLAFMLLGLSLFLIPHWNLQSISYLPNTKDFVNTIWLSLPVLIFAFNFSAAISSFVQSQRRRYGNHAATEINNTLHKTSIILLIFVMFFVFSCVFALTPEQLNIAKQENISVLSFMANEFQTPIFSYFGPLIAITAISSSFFGHYLGAREGLEGFIERVASIYNIKINKTYLNRFTGVFFFSSIWFVAIINPSILEVIEIFIGPIMGFILFLLPMYAIKNIDSLAIYRGKISNIFVVLMGMLTITALVYRIL